MTSGHEALPGGRRADLRSARRELALTLLLGAAGAGLIVLASRRGWAQVQTIPPRPLPASRVTVTGSALVPYAEALALAGLATLAAVLASRGLARRAHRRAAGLDRREPGCVSLHGVQRGRHLSGELERRPGYRGRRLGYGRQRVGDICRPERRLRGRACDVQCCRLAGTGRDRCARDDRRGRPGRLAGRPDGGDVEPVRLTGRRRPPCRRSRPRHRRPAG